MGWKCCRFELIQLNWHKSFPLLSIRHAGSRFAQENIAPQDNVGWVKSVVESTRFDRIDMNRTSQLKFLATNWHELFPLLLTRHAGSWFSRDTTPCESSRVVKYLIRIDWSLLPRFKNEEDSCIIIPSILTSGGLCRVGWKCCRFDSIRLDSIESTLIVSPTVDSTYRKSICAGIRKYSAPGQSRVG